MLCNDVGKVKYFMARKTFISYKYSEAREIRDRIISSLGDDATYYRGERATSPDLTDFTTSTIKNNLKNKIYDTSVLILVISPHMNQSKWISWEVEYALKDQKRGNKYSHSNGIIGVVKNDYFGDSTWFTGRDCLSQNVYLPDIVTRNRINRLNTYSESRYHLNDTTWINQNSYIPIVTENTFLRNPKQYIEDAFERSQRLYEYDICKISNKDRLQRSII